MAPGTRLCSTFLVFACESCLRPVYLMTQWRKHWFFACPACSQPTYGTPSGRSLTSSSFRVPLAASWPQSLFPYPATVLSLAVFAASFLLATSQVHSWFLPFCFLFVGALTTPSTGQVALTVPLAAREDQLLCLSFASRSLCTLWPTSLFSF
jgi:hypothetical protein